MTCTTVPYRSVLYVNVIYESTSLFFVKCKREGSNKNEQNVECCTYS